MGALVAFPRVRARNTAATVTEGAMECQAHLHALREQGGPLWAAARDSGRWDVESEAQALLETLGMAETIARRLAGTAEAEPACPDGEQLHLGHGSAA